MIDLETYQHARALMTCAPAWQCPKEHCCFHTAKAIIDQYEAQQHSAALQRAEDAQLEPDDVAYYAPHFPPVIDWELARPDWSAA
jgi:hypothetical protein